MSLRARLALLYTSIVGGILLLFGAAVYFSVSYTLVNQIDNTLRATASVIVEKTEVNLVGQLTVTYPNLESFSDVFIQVWGRNQRLIGSNIPNFRQSLDQTSLESGRQVFRVVPIQTATRTVHFRVYTIPLEVSGREIGVLQLGYSLAVVEATQQVLLGVLLIGAVISMSVAGLAGWMSTRQAFLPLQAVTRTALQITRADDLSRRIPYSGPPDDEIGQLIIAFNDTLGRLENLFDSQRRFLADVGHELRTPLTVIRGNVDLMRKMNRTDEESMASIESEVDRLTRMVGDLLLLAQAESGKVPLDRRVVELDTLVLEVLQQMRVLARDKVQLKLGEIDQVLVCGDQDRLKQVLVNLVGNAIRYTPSGGEVVVGVGKVEERARLTVSDSGPGIPAEDLPFIFDRFYRGEKSRTRSKDGKGFGLGLSIAYWIVRNHGGRIEVVSREPVGTTFCVWLPLSGNGICEPEEAV